MKPKERKAGLMLADVTAASIAKELEVNPSHVSMVINGVRRSARVEAAIARALELPVEEVFPPEVAASVAAA